MTAPVLIASSAPPLRDQAGARRRKVTDARMERLLLLDAAMRVLERTGWWGFKVDSVLRQARLSTRSFYRHFEKKNDLLLALLEHEINGVTVHIERLTAAAFTPTDKITAYVTAIVDTAYRSDLAKRAALFATQWRELQQHYPDALRRCRAGLIAPLENAIRAGQATGDFRVEDSAATAQVIFSLVSGMTADEVTLGCETPRTEFEGTIMPFVARALGLDDAGCQRC